MDAGSRMITRIYEKNSDCPGLSMSRSLGDTVAHNLGK